MDQLQIGDEVLTADGSYSKVYSFGHFSPKTKTSFLQIRTDSMDYPLEISLEHLIYVQDKATKTTRLVSAGELKVGDNLVSELGLSSEILSIHSVQREGAYSPLTASGQLAVKGVLASSYVSRVWLKDWPITTPFSMVPLYPCAFSAPFSAVIRRPMTRRRAFQHGFSSGSRWNSGNWACLWLRA